MGNNEKQVDRLSAYNKSNNMNIRGSVIKRSFYEFI